MARGGNSLDPLGQPDDPVGEVLFLAFDPQARGMVGPPPPNPSDEAIAFMRPRQRRNV
jgi:hypothetical protein